MPGAMGEEEEEELKVWRRMGRVKSEQVGNFGDRKCRFNRLRHEQSRRQKMKGSVQDAEEGTRMLW